MSEFTPQHEEQLRDYFEGVYAGRMGLKSATGPMLEHLYAMSVEARPDPNKSYITIRKASQESGRAAWDLSHDARNAAETTTNVRAILRMLDISVVEALRVHYEPRPRGGLPYGVAEIDPTHRRPPETLKKSERTAWVAERMKRLELVDHALRGHAALIAFVLGEQRAREFVRSVASDDAGTRRIGRQGLLSGRHQARELAASIHDAYATAAEAWTVAEHAAGRAGRVEGRRKAVAA